MFSTMPQGKVRHRSWRPPEFYRKGPGSGNGRYEPRSGPRKEPRRGLRHFREASWALGISVRASRRLSRAHDDDTSRSYILTLSARRRPC
jgi:hypothetical protein